MARYAGLFPPQQFFFEPNNRIYIEHPLRRTSVLLDRMETKCIHMLKMLYDQAVQVSDTRNDD